MCHGKLEKICVESIVRGYHAYMDNWTPAIGDEFQVEIEEMNVHDRQAVAVKVNGNIVGRSSVAHDITVDFEF